MIAGLVVALLSANAQPAPSQAFEVRLVIGSGVVCRAQPDRASAVVGAHRVGEPLTVRGISQDRSGAAWYEVVSRRTCWVSGALTVAFAGYDAPDAALAAIAEHALALGVNASFEHLVAVDNLPESPGQIRTLLGVLRESLQDVTVAGKDHLLSHVSEIEATCLGSALDLTNPRAIPELVKALGLGFSVVARRLAEFGQDAAPAMLGVVTSAASAPEAVASGLVTLRLMIEGAGARPLSAGTREDIARAAEQWLTARPQSILTLGAAIDLAAALGDQDLRRVLERLASDPNAVASLGIGAGSIDQIRRRASDGLAGDAAPSGGR